jgi:hypothetical protein
MNRANLLRIAIVTIGGGALLISLLAIVVTGPVVVRLQRLEFGIAPGSAERLRADVEKLCSDFTPRSFRHTENLDRAADWIALELRQAGLEVELQDYEVDGRRYRNVVGRRSGLDPSADVAILGAHYDTFGEFPGADDNASGVAVMLEVARTLPDGPGRRDRYFVAFSTAEPPHFATESMGSHVFAERLTAAGRGVDSMIALDRVGYYTDEPGSQHFPVKGFGWLVPDRGDFVAVVGDLGAGRWIERVKRGMRATEALPVHSLRAPARWTPVLGSDHLSFRRRGLPGVQITDTAFLRNDRIHTAEDTPETLDYERMSRLVVAIQGALWEGVPDEPRSRAATSREISRQR